MKTQSLVLSLVLVASTLCGTLQAESRPSSKKVEPLSRAVSAEGSSGQMRYGFGFATFGTASIGSSAVSTGVTPGAMSLWIDFTPRMSVQTTFGVNSSSPFTFGWGAIFRSTLQGSQANGFHGGLGFNLGTVGGAAAAGTSFFANIFPVLGFHFSLGGALDNIQLSFDGGPIFAVTPSPFQFTFVPHSALGGASIHWFF